ncbi:MAG: TetR family transcriptional regulator [Pseudomonadota bacterium]
MTLKTRRQDTKAALMRAAERLFAEKGLGGVSVRDITLAAGARNQSALHYHFGGMSELISEVFAHRYRAIEDARRKRLAEMAAAGTDGDILKLMEAAVSPLLEACHEEDGRLYARFCVQLTTDPRFDVLQLIRDTGMESANLMRELIGEALADLPEDILRTRLTRLFTISMILMADYAGLVEAGNPPPLDEATCEAASTLTGFLLAPAPSQAG